MPGTGIRVFALDTSVWPRPRSRTLQGLRYERSPTQAVQGHSAVKVHAYSTLAWIPERGESWMLPVDSRWLRGKETAVAAGVEQVKLLDQHRSQAGMDVVVGDGSYGNHRFLGAVKDLSCVSVVRLRRDRVLYGVPGPYPGKGRPAGPKVAPAPVPSAIQWSNGARKQLERAARNRNSIVKVQW